MKTYVIMLAKTFPRGHFAEGRLTFFKEKMMLALGCPHCDTEQDLSGDNISKCNSCMYATMNKKLHTIRGNYELWESRFKEIDAGKACLSIREWEGKPYRSKQVEIIRLTKEDGIGLQRLSFAMNSHAHPFIDGISSVKADEIAHNDGITYFEWREREWFSDCDLSKQFAIIHFTKFRY